MSNSSAEVIAPCNPLGEVRSVWDTDGRGGSPGMYAVVDNDSKEAECRCPGRQCCVDGRNHVIQGPALSRRE